MPSIQHVNVVVPPGATGGVAAFYAEVFGLTPVDEPARLDPSGAWLAVEGHQQIHISERPGEAHPDAHFALVVDDFAAVRRRIDAAGAPWQDSVDVFGGGRGFTRDPAGNKVEVLEQAGRLA